MSDPIKPIHVQVPATVSGLGPGVGALGLAVELTDSIRVEFDQGNNAVKGNRTLCAAYRAWPADQLPGARFTLQRGIPVRAGLGDETALTVAGLAAAAHATATKGGEREILRLAVVNGADLPHAAAAVLGGMTTAFGNTDGVHALHVANHLSLAVILFIPKDTASGASVPKRVRSEADMADLAHLSFLITALIWGRWELLGPAMHSRLLEPGSQTSEIVAAARAGGAYGAALSGQSRTVIALSPHDEKEHVASAIDARAEQLGLQGSTTVTSVRELGARVTVETEVAE